MKKKFNLFLIILIITIFLSSYNFAAVTGQKGLIPKGAKDLKGDIIDLKILDINLIKYSSYKRIEGLDGEYCGEVNIKTNYKSESSSFAIGIVISIPLKDKSYYPYYMDELYGYKGAVGKNIFTVKKYSYFYSPGSNDNVFKSYIRSSNSMCEEKFLDFYVFKPYKIGLGYQDNVYYYATQKINNNGKLTDVKGGGVYIKDLKDYSNFLYHKDFFYLSNSERSRKAVYFYNVDYAYKIPFVEEKSKSTISQTSSTNNISQTSSTSNSTSNLVNTVPCDDSFISVSGYPYKYKCSDDHEKYQVCINGKIDSEHVFSKNSKLKKKICKGEPVVSSPEKPQEPAKQEPISQENLKSLEIENEGYVSNIKYLLNNDWKDITLVDYPNAYIFENKLQDNKIKINLDSFNDEKVYAIISTSSQKEKIETALKEIYQTGTFSNYIKQTENNPFVINDKFSGFSKLEFNSNNITFDIKKENTTENIVFIFMQKTKDNKISLLYTNFYALDKKSQSLFYFCLINKNIVDFYCKGHSCNLDISCLGSKRWDFNPIIFEDLISLKINVSDGEKTIEENNTDTTDQSHTSDIENTNVSQTTLKKGADGCYTSDPVSLALIRKENGVGITKEYFSGKRTMNSIVLPTTNSTDSNPSLTVEQIRIIFDRKGTNIPQKVKDASPVFYNLGLLYNIDPVFILSFFKAERSLFNQNSPSITQTMINNNDISGIVFCRCGGTKNQSATYCKYPTIEQAIEATYLNLEKGTTYNSNIYKNKSFSQVSKTWNGRDDYATQMNTYLKETYIWANK